MCRVSFTLSVLVGISLINAPCLPVDRKRLLRTALCCTALHYTTLWELYFFTLHYTALHCITLHYTALHCTVLHCNMLDCTVLHCATLHFTSLHCCKRKYQFPKDREQEAGRHATVLYRALLHWSTLNVHCRTLNCSTLHCAAGIAVDCAQEAAVEQGKFESNVGALQQ